MADHWLAAFVPLLDCAVLTAAREMGFLREAGVELELVKEPSWSSLRDHLRLGHVDCAHALAPLPIAGALGIGQARLDVGVPFVLGRGGNTVTLAKPLAEALRRRVRRRTPAGWGAALAAEIRARGRPLTLATVHPFSNHNLDMRYWLAACGIHPDRDVSLVAIPPPLMVENLRAGRVDGFCVGEPWNSVAVAEGLGEIVVTKSELVPRGLEKVLAVRAVELHDAARLARLLAGLSRAARWCDAPENHVALAELLSRPEYVGVRPELLAGALAGRLARGDGTYVDDREFIYFYRHGANAPRPAEASWLYAQIVRWGYAEPRAAREDEAAAVFRDDLYRALVDAELDDPGMVPPYDSVPITPGDVDRYLAQLAFRTQ